eukprot:TRINITY_DN11138_c0_g1_i7.p1 TRINITY_DN11138_c0_g1~~TRINITY_DN11138_c0_g1_i7.p1  ORF type:complete len:175 (+),score=28.36 TRINITY_DN11138_c0_g1_i7:213-737(+)
MGRTYLQIQTACENDDIETLRALLETLSQDDLHKLLEQPPLSRLDTPPLEIAANKGHMDCVKLLIQAGQPSQTTLNKLVHITCQRGYADILELLLDNGADPNARDRYGDCCPLHAVAHEGHVDCAELLLLRGADVNVATNGHVPWRLGRALPPPQCQPGSAGCGSPHAPLQCSS